MKRFITISLLTIIFLQTFSTFVIQAEYFLNKDYIARVLCINKAKPAMHCRGKCYLVKQLKEQENDHAPTLKKERFEIQPFFLPASLSLEIATFSNKRVFHNANDPVQHAFLSSIFHPPTV